MLAGKEEGEGGEGTFSVRRDSEGALGLGRLESSVVVVVVIVGELMLVCVCCVCALDGFVCGGTR